MSPQDQSGLVSMCGDMQREAQGEAFCVRLAIPAFSHCTF